MGAIVLKQSQHAKNRKINTNIAGWLFLVMVSLAMCFFISKLFSNVFAINTHFFCDEKQFFLIKNKLGIPRVAKNEKFP